MHTSESLVSVVIPTFNRRQSLAEIVSAVLNDPRTGEVVVVVDGCRDGTYEFLRDWAASESRIRVFFQENRGPAEARRNGIRESRFDVVVLLDDDVRADAGLVSGHAQRHTDDDNRLVVGFMPIILPTPRRPGQAAAILYEEYYEAACRSYEVDPSSILTCLWAGNLSIKRDSALSLATESESRLDYHEDLRFGLQCKEAGLEASFDRSLAAEHSLERSLRGFMADCRRSGEAKVELIMEYPSLEQELNPMNSLTIRQTYIARYFATSFARPLVVPFMMTLSYAAGQGRAWKIETLAVRVLRTIELSFAFKRARKASMRRTT